LNVGVACRFVWKNKLYIGRGEKLAAGIYSLSFSAGVTGWVLRGLFAETTQSGSASVAARISIRRDRQMKSYD